MIMLVEEMPCMCHMPIDGDDKEEVEHIIKFSGIAARKV